MIEVLYAPGKKDQEVLKEYYLEMMNAIRTAAAADAQKDVAEVMLVLSALLPGMKGFLEAVCNFPGELLSSNLRLKKILHENSPGKSVSGQLRAGVHVFPPLKR